LDLRSFEHLPDECRVWIHGFARSLTAVEQMIIKKRLDRFAVEWQSHGQPVDSTTTIAFDRFVVTAAHCPGDISGCSMDSFLRQFKELRDDDGLDGLQGGLVYYRRPEGEIDAVGHLDFFNLVEQGVIGLDTPVIDTLIHNLGELRRRGLELCFGDSWHSKTYPLQATR
jgi:hypothetical protein